LPGRKHTDELGDRLAENVAIRARDYRVRTIAIGVDVCQVDEGLVKRGPGAVEMIASLGLGIHAVDLNAEPNPGHWLAKALREQSLDGALVGQIVQIGINYVDVHDLLDAQVRSGPFLSSNRGVAQVLHAITVILDGGTGEFHEPLALLARH